MSDLPMSEQAIGNGIPRREALGIVGAALAGCSVSRAAPVERGDVIAGEVWQPPFRRPPGYELVNSWEFRDQARHILAPEVFARIDGEDRMPFNYMTFRPRMGISTVDMDLSVPLLGVSLFTPIIVAPVAEQAMYHADAEIGTIRGAKEAHTIAIVSARSSTPLEQVAREAGEPFWVSVYADAEGERQAAEAKALNANAIFVTVGAAYDTSGRTAGSASGRRRIDWSRVERIQRATGLPLVVKGVTDPRDAARALELGVAGVVVSDHARDGRDGMVAPLDALVPVAEAVGGRVPVLVDGSFRRGTDVLKALILGADAVLLGRPIMWGLAAYGAEGVKWVLYKLQDELARAFAMVGASRPDLLTRDHLRIHTAATV